MKMDTKQLLRDSINMFWLRPENGLDLATITQRSFDISPRPGEISADFACGDGSTSFFRTGGRFAKSYDVYLGASNQFKHQEIVENNIDVFDYCDDNFKVEIITRPKLGFTFGTDHKKTLLQKAAELDYYDDLLQADLNDSAPMGSKLDYAYCNSLYWADSVVAISNIANAVRQGGRLIFEVWTPTVFEYDFSRLYPKVDKKWALLLNRGRYDTYISVKTESEWETVFVSNGLRVVNKVNLIPHIVMSFWNYGLRPIYPVLRKMVAAMTNENRTTIKEEWVDIWVELLHPLLETPGAFGEEEKNIRVQYCLEKI